MKDIMTIKFQEDDKNKIHIFYDLHQKDTVGFFLTSFQKYAILKMLQQVRQTIMDNDMESLK